MSFSSCPKEDQFILIRDNAAFNGLNFVCTVVTGQEGTLARIENQEDFDFAKNLLDENNVTSPVYIGVHRPNRIIGDQEVNDPTLFEFVDGLEGNTSFFSTAGEFPWGRGQPNGSGGPSDACVLWRRTNNTILKIGRFVN